MDIKIKSVNFYHEEPEYIIRNPQRVISVLESNGEMARIKFSACKNGIELEGKLSIPKDEYISNINKLEDHIEELLLGKTA